jgi:hypothetical protein
VAVRTQDTKVLEAVVGRLTVADCCT